MSSEAVENEMQLQNPDARAVLARHHVTLHGVPGAPVMIFAHGFGCDQAMWRFVWPAFAAEHRVVLFDHIGMGGADSASFDATRHATLDGYARDVLDICRALELTDVVYVGHSVSAMIGALAAVQAPDLFCRLVMLCPSPRYTDDATYVGGFTRADIDELLEAMSGNLRTWSDGIAPLIMGNPERPELSQELADSFCRADPALARHFARVTFLSDNRADLAQVEVPTLVVQCAQDSIAPRAVGDYVITQLPDARSVVIDAVGHCPNLSAPEATVGAIRDYLTA